MEILWERTVSAVLRPIRRKLCRNCAFPKNFHTRKFGKISVFYAVLLVFYRFIYHQNLINYFALAEKKVECRYCVESLLIWSYSGPHFTVFGLNAERYSLSLPIQSECGKIRTTIAPNTDTFYAGRLFANLRCGLRLFLKALKLHLKNKSLHYIRAESYHNCNFRCTKNEVFHYGFLQ